MSGRCGPGRAWLNARPLTVAIIALRAGAACGGPQAPGEAGSICFRVDDCDVGLACVPSKPSSMKRVCSADLSGIVSMVEPAPSRGETSPAAAPDAGDLPDAGANAPEGRDD